jgi:hypothetical protein
MGQDGLRRQDSSLVPRYLLLFIPPVVGRNLSSLPIPVNGSVENRDDSLLPFNKR